MCRVVQSSYGLDALEDSLMPTVQFPPPEIVARLTTIEHVEVDSSTNSPVRAAVGALLGACFGAVVWAGISAIAGYPVGLVAFAIAFATGIGGQQGGRGRTNQIIAAGFAVFGYLLGLALMSGLFAWMEISDMALLEATVLIFVELVVSTFTGFGAINLAFVVWITWGMLA